MFFVQASLAVCTILLLSTQLGTCWPVNTSEQTSSSTIKDSCLQPNPRNQKLERDIGDLHKAANALKMHFTSGPFSRVSPKVAKLLSRRKVANFPDMDNVNKSGSDDCKQISKSLRIISIFYQEMAAWENTCDSSTLDNMTELMIGVLFNVRKTLNHLENLHQLGETEPMFETRNMSLCPVNDSIRQYSDYRIVVATTNFTEAILHHISSR